MIGFRRNFENFPEAPRSLKIMFWHVFWCPGGTGTSPKWFWIDLGSFIFSSFFKEFSQKFRLKMSNLWELELGRVPFVCPDSYKYHCSKLKEAITKLGLFFKWIAPQNFNKQAKKVIKKIRKMSLGAWGQNLRLAPGWRRITLLEHKNMLYESFKDCLEARR